MDVAAGGEGNPRPPHRLEVPLHGLRGSLLVQSEPSLRQQPSVFALNLDLNVFEEVGSIKTDRAADARQIVSDVFQRQHTFI